MDALELLKEIKRRMIDGTPLDVGLAFRVEECICAMESAQAAAEAEQAMEPEEPPVRPPEPPVVVADTVEELNEALNDPVPADAQATGGFSLNPFRRS